MKTYRQFLEFVSKNYGSFIFAVIFYSLWIVYKYAASFDPQLNGFPGRMIGEATLNAYDINKRISVFYRSGLIFFISLTFLSVVAWRISFYAQRFLRSSEFRIINYTSIAGITFFFFNLWTHSFDSSLELIYCIHKAVISGCLLKFLILRNNQNKHFLDTAFYTIAFVTGVSVFFVLNELSVLFNLYPQLDFYITIFCCVLIFTGLCAGKIKFMSDEEALKWLNSLAHLLLPLSIIPLLSFFKDEIYLILNRHEIYYLSPRRLYLLLLFGLLGFMYIRYFRFRKGFDKNLKDNSSLVALRYLPLLVAGLTTYTFYNAFISPSNEMFEAGNRFLPLMEFQKEGVIPVLEKFNSHVLSELFFGSIYAFFNGLHGREMYIYEFMYQVFWALMVYVFIYRLSKNGYIALFIVFLFPFTDILLTDYTIIALLALFITDKVINELPSFKNYLLLFICLAFLLLWRVDIGYPSIIAALSVLIVYYISREQFKINFKLMFRVLVMFIAFIILAFTVIGLIRHINVPEKLYSGLNYLASAQTYGLVSIGDSQSTVFKMHYFVFPLIIIFGLIVILFCFKKFNVSRNQRFIFSAFLFLSVYYIVNFQRGLVRHSFIEGNDFAVSAFLFFILGGSVFLFFRKRSLVVRFILFIIFSVLMMNYKYPAIQEYRNLYSKMFVRLDSFNAIQPKEKINRCVDTSDYEEKYFGEFKKVIRQYLNEDQTFIDFSNLPMLYYYTGKISPSYFYQNPLTIHNEYLQKKFISDLSAYDAPLIVFSHFPENWWDNVDGVPNTMRHYRMAEYFYLHYKPFIIADQLCIWKKNDYKIENKQKVIYSYNRTTDSLNTSGASINHTSSLKGKFLIKLSYRSSIPVLKVSGSVQLPQHNNDIDHIAYYVLMDSLKALNCEITDKDKVNSVQIIQCDFIPDFYSSFPQQDDLRLLPFIWGNYDDSVSAGKVIVELCRQPQTLLENNITYFNFDHNADKNTGNGIFINLTLENPDALSIDLLYGSSKHGYKGSFNFTIPPGEGSRSFYVRISSQYNWYDPSVDYIALTAKTNRKIIVNTVQLLKGN